jgi:DNA-binding transcriptional LysR family regulator
MVPRQTYNVKERSCMTSIRARDTVPLVLDLRLLETFREVAARGSFSAAAEALAFTQPAVSQHVARLEKQIGTKLFERDARGVTPTRAGRSLLGHAEALLEAARRAEAEVRAEAGLYVPRVRIGSFASGASSIVPMGLRELRSAHPDVRPTLRIVEDEVALEELLAGRIDVALLIGTKEAELPLRDGLTGELVLEDPMLVAVPASHPRARQSAIALDELRDEQWLITCDSTTCQDSLIVRHACREAGFEPNIHFESDDYLTLLGLTASGMGVSVIPSLAALSLPAEVVVRPIPGDPPKRFISVARRAGDTDMAVEAALDAMRIAGRRLSMGIAPSPAIVAA